MFNEIDYGPDENQPETQVIARIGAGALKAWEEHAIVPPGWNFKPKEAISHWQTFAARIINEFPEKTILVVTSNGIARFSPWLTGDFEAFCNQHKIKISTGALCIFEKSPDESPWRCAAWNIKPD